MSLLYILEAHGKHRLSETELGNISARARTLPNLMTLYVFTPIDGGHDPFLKDEDPPFLVILAQLHGDPCLQKLLISSELEKLSGTLRKLDVDVELLQEAMSFDPYKSSDTRDAHADVSYLVNYQRPAEDEGAFLKYYRAHHPQILLNFPDIRRCELGLPIEWTPHADIKHANRMLYCEVSFDSLEALNESLNSEIRAELRKDYECFPPFSGAVTHFAMRRQSLV